MSTSGDVLSSPGPLTTLAGPAGDRTEASMNQFAELRDEIKRRAEQDPEATYRTAGYQGDLKLQGDQLVGLCPFHAETNPSFKITVRGQYQGKWRCFGSCNAGGDVIDFRARLSDITNLEKGLRGTGGPPGD